MKYAIVYIFIFVILVLLVGGVYYVARNSGKLACENEYNKKMIDLSAEKEKRFSDLKNKITELNSKVRKIKNEECDTIRNYPLASKCRK